MFIFPTVACTSVSRHSGILKRGSSYHFDPTNLCFFLFCLCFPHANIELPFLRQVNTPAQILANIQLMLRPDVCWEQLHEVKRNATHGQTSCPRRAKGHYAATATCSLPSPAVMIARQPNSESPSSWQLYRPNCQAGWYKYVGLPRKILKWIWQQQTAEVFMFPLWHREVLWQRSKGENSCCLATISLTAAQVTSYELENFWLRNLMN